MVGESPNLYNEVAGRWKAVSHQTLLLLNTSPDSSGRHCIIEVTEPQALGEGTPAPMLSGYYRVELFYPEHEQSVIPAMPLNPVVSLP